MAVVRGVKERVHLPLYDSLKVKPRRQLREVASSSVLRFFVNVQGKSKLETNMQSSSLLPHWNTFEARALRVVLSDLPTAFPEAVEACRGELGAVRRLEAREIRDEMEAGAGNGDGGAAGRVGEMVERARALQGLGAVVDRLEATLSAEPPPPATELPEALEAARPDLIQILRRSTIQRKRPEAVQRFVEQLEAPGKASRPRASKKGGGEEARGALTSLRPAVELVEALGALDPGELEREATGSDWSERLRSHLEWLECHDCPPSPGELLRCLRQRLQDPLLLPTADQLAGRLERIFSTLIYNSVTTFTVGEKTMIQMPTWFFPAGGGVWSEDSRSITHGLPTPQATFRFAEPVVIDTQQNFRVEIEIPEQDVLAEIQRLYGPLFLWVVLDGFMVRDVQ